MPTDNDDSAALARLDHIFDLQRKAFEADRYPAAKVRRERLTALIGMMSDNRDRIKVAINDDFGSHPQAAADLTEILGVIGRAQYVLDNFESWMEPSPREVDAALFGTAKAYVQQQPKGVIGNMVPWNFPFDIAVGPTIDMLAAGNRVILKPSELAPACAALLEEMVASAFDPDLVAVVCGGVELARAFATKPWDHLLYTGSPGIGREVMMAAAANLTPVTLELGGKCPAIFTPGSVTPANVESVIGTKMIKNGQMCVSVDYCLVPQDEVPAFVEHAKLYVAKNAPTYSRSSDCTGIISERHLDRLEGMLSEARSRQARVVELEEGGQVDRTTRRMPVTLVIDPPRDLAVMREEIFGPILPIVPFTSIETALAAINAGDRPLGLYVFGEDRAVTGAVIAGTSSGGAAINVCALQSAIPAMGFGGSGTSGMGRHHGIEGFREFSNPRGIFERGSGDLIEIFYPPYSKAETVLAAMDGQSGQPG